MSLIEGEIEEPTIIPGLGTYPGTATGVEYFISGLVTHQGRKVVFEGWVPAQFMVCDQKSPCTPASIRALYITTIQIDGSEKHLVCIQTSVLHEKGRPKSIL